MYFPHSNTSKWHFKSIFLHWDALRRISNINHSKKKSFFAYSHIIPPITQYINIINISRKSRNFVTPLCNHIRASLVPHAIHKFKYSFPQQFIQNFNLLSFFLKVFTLFTKKKKLKPIFSYKLYLFSFCYNT